MVDSSLVNFKSSGLEVMQVKLVMSNLPISNTRAMSK